MPEELGGSGYGLEETVVVAEELGRALAPGAFVPTLIASAVLVAAGTDDVKARLLPGLADGSTLGAAALGGDVAASRREAVGLGRDGARRRPRRRDPRARRRRRRGRRRQGDRRHRRGRRRTSTPPAAPAGSRSTAPAATSCPAPAGLLIDIARTILAAEAVGVARESTDLAAEYAKVRLQFGRPIAMYQGVKHHCANMAVATELATAAVWDAARAAAGGGDQFTYAAAVAASLAGPAANLCVNLGMQVHGGIGYTWEHDCHVYMRRATALLGVLDADAAATDVVDLTRNGVKRDRTVDLPPEAESIRSDVQAFVATLAGLDEKAVTAKLIESGYAMPHWPKPYGLEAGSVAQLVIEQEFAKAGVKRPQLGITGWVILTMIQHGTPEQVSRWVAPALAQEVSWCQLFSEPDAGSDAAGIKTKGTRVDGGWLVNGQKVWTSGAKESSFGLATIRTNPDVPKHQGITTMVIDMKSKGVEVRPLKQATGDSHFNEVFFNDVFVPDDDVIGPVDNGWTVARATLGNESVSIGGGGGGGATPDKMIISLVDQHPDRLRGGVPRVGTFLANSQAMAMLNLRTVFRAVEGSGPGPEGAMTKLVLSEQGHEATAILSELAGQDLAFMEGVGGAAGQMVLSHRGLSIAGGTSEIKRNQIGERILGLPRDPLIK